MSISNTCNGTRCLHYMVLVNTCNQFNAHMTIFVLHYNEVIISAMASQITSLTRFYSTVYSVADQRKRQSSASLTCVRRFRRSPVNSPHKGPVTRKRFPFDDVIMMMKGIYSTHPGQNQILPLTGVFSTILRPHTCARTHPWYHSELLILSPGTNCVFIIMTS